MLSEKVTSLEKQLRNQTKAVKPENRRGGVVPDKALLKENQKLEGLVRDRTEQLNKIKWQQEMAAKSEDAGGEKMLVVLNQQLTSSRADNERLLDRIRQLERPDEGQGAGAKSKVKASKRRRRSTDDLSRIRGIGPKLVDQLKGLGIIRFDQIACLSSADLDDKKHVLHSFKKRIERDDWVSQAATLSNGA